MTALLELDGVGMSFGGLRAVDDLSFGVEEGQIVGLIGPNGAGKTTVFNLITGVYKPKAGIIRWQGIEITGAKPARVAGLGLRRTFQTIRLFSDMSVFENVRAGCHLAARQQWWQGLLSLPAQRREEAELTARTHEILRRLDLDSVADSPATSLIILDEPAAGLNESESAGLNETIYAIRETGVTILLVEHDMNVVMQVSDHIVVINFGRKIAEGDAASVRANPDVIEAYLGRDSDEEDV
ncbi:MAG: ABC transporter ATP-binding protein [Acidiphilium sp. 34-60-192]|nr:MAG: ABC transporter ATP-binding protein [Acidiphilium sp. 34-60-192]